MTSFPHTRLRRLRGSSAIRRMLSETTLQPSQMIQPLFVCTGHNKSKPVPSMPGVCQLSIDKLIQEARTLCKLGIPAVILFGIPKRKDPLASDAYHPDGIIQKAVRALKKDLPGLFVITDLCFCEYTDHGHCGLIGKTGRKTWTVDNDATLNLMAQTAVSQAQAGADCIAPSGMMDGGVKTIRRALDKARYHSVSIMSYAAKYSSAFYGPFREAAQSAPCFGDRKTYQMDPANAREALREVAADIKEGADMIMIKPALAYLDVIRQVKDKFHVPVAAYNVSGEYAMVKAASAKGWIDGPMITKEILTSIKRAGADLILSYHAKEFAKTIR